MFEAVGDWITKYANLPSVGKPPNFGLADAVDILIVAFLLYFMLMWIRKTRAWSLVKGLVLVIFLFALSNVFGLVTIIWLVDTLLKMGLVAIVVLLQPELRKALEQIGRGKYISRTFLRGGDQASVSLRTANEIVKAAYAMGKVRTGALMVIEQNDNLSEFEHTGVEIDSLVSSQLIINVFEKNTPLHDGAMIIRQNRVAAAACILPLTDEDISQELGTRHRASLGTSEISDAIVVVVSEETGAVSVAMGGKLTRDVNDNQLREILMRGDEGAEQESLSFSLFKKNKDRS